jgi:hypothetical protein
MRRETMGKRTRNKGQKNRRVARWHDLTGTDTTTRTVFPKHMSAMMVKPRGGQPVSREAFKELYSSHVKGIGQSMSDLVAECLHVPEEEKRRLKRLIILKDGSMQKEPWHEIKLNESEYRKVSIFFYARKVILVWVNKIRNTIAFSQGFDSVTRVLKMYQVRGEAFIQWGAHQPLADAAQAVPSS